MSALQPIFTGEHIRLTAIESNDLATIAAWYADDDFIRHFDGTAAYPKSVDAWREWLKELQNTTRDYTFGIRRHDDPALIGIVGIDGILWNNRNASLAIAIGDTQHRGKGYGVDAMRLLLRFAFHELNLHRVYLTVFSYNTPAIRLYEKLGFHQEGVYREHILRDGQAYDMLLYGLLAKEWQP